MRHPFVDNLSFGCLRKNCTRNLVIRSGPSKRRVEDGIGSSSRNFKMFPRKGAAGRSRFRRRAFSAPFPAFMTNTRTPSNVSLSWVRECISKPCLMQTDCDRRQYVRKHSLETLNLQDEARSHFQKIVSKHTAFVPPLPAVSGTRKN